MRRDPWPTLRARPIPAEWPTRTELEELTADNTRDTIAQLRAGGGRYAGLGAEWFRDGDEPLGGTSSSSRRTAP